ncbi:MAG: T9SS type A sorting domain-containing protein, partial [Bacteroidota bacterium]
YPNPTSDIINIEYLMEQDGTFTAELVNLTGVVVAKTDRISSKAGMNKATMNLWDLPNGAYILKVTVGDQTGVRKVVVNR